MRFDQTKFLARDPASLAGFYEEALDCVTVVPLQEISDGAVPRAFGVPGASIALTVLRLPGRGDRGPSLELYSVSGERPREWHYQPGQGQIAFEVEDLESSIAAVISAGGDMLGEIVEWEGPSGTVARFVLLRDPEGNVVDLWRHVS